MLWWCFQALPVGDGWEIRYCICLQNDQKGPGTCILVQWVWHITFVPKHAFRVWLLFQGKQATKDRLSHLGIINDGFAVSVIRERMQSTRFFKYRFSMRMRNLPGSEIRRRTWLDSWELADGFPISKKLILFTFLAVVVYSIWVERNRTFA